jgi:hypothetical protein
MFLADSVPAVHAAAAGIKMQTCDLCPRSSAVLPMITLSNALRCTSPVWLHHRDLSDRISARLEGRQHTHDVAPDLQSTVRWLLPAAPPDVHNVHNQAPVFAWAARKWLISKKLSTSSTCTWTRPQQVCCRIHRGFLPEQPCCTTSVNLRRSLQLVPVSGEHLVAAQAAAARIMLGQGSS